MNTTANQPHKQLAVGDYVIVGQEEEYAGLVGQVKEIIRFGSPEHDTGNPTDDIIVDLSQAPYSDEKKAEILALANELGYDADSYDDVPLNSVILAPDDLVRITSHEYELYNIKLMTSLQSALELSEQLSLKHHIGMRKALTARVKHNYNDFKSDMLKSSPQDIFDSAPRIHAVSNAYDYMTDYHGYSEDELRFFLQFKNPLDMVAEYWHERNTDISDMCFTVDFIMEPERQKLMLEEYLLYVDKPSRVPKRGDRSTDEKKPLSLLRELNDAKTEAAARKISTKDKQKNQGDKEV